MKRELSRLELVQLVGRILSAEGTEREIHRMVLLFEDSVPDPEGSALIFWPQHHKLTQGRTDLTAEEIVDLAFQYRPLPLITPPPGGSR